MTDLLKFFSSVTSFSKPLGILYNDFIIDADTLGFNLTILATTGYSLPYPLNQACKADLDSLRPFLSLGDQNYFHDSACLFLCWHLRQ